MPDTDPTPITQQDPAEGSRKIVDRELEKIPDPPDTDGSVKKPDLPSDGSRSGTANT